ncbi:MAG: hypothetical protein ACOCT9_03075, partial [archaeon]
GVAGGINVYGYVGNNCVNRIDFVGFFSKGFIDFNAIYDFIGNYNDMRDANTIGADKYFHCMANCEASKKGTCGALTALVMSVLREELDLIRCKSTLGDCKADMIANMKGLKGYVSALKCKEICKPFRPKGLDSWY